MGVGTEVAHGDVFIGEGLDTATGKGSGGVAINKQGQHGAGGYCAENRCHARWFWRW